MKHLRIVGAIALCAVSLSACVNAPVDDGGRGQIAAAYYNIPDIDQQVMVNGQPVNPALLEQDKNQCAANVNINPGQAAANNAVAGALVGALLGAALGGGRRYTGALVARGAATGAVVAGANTYAYAGMTLHQALGRCMAGRGYNVLD
jgi:hypothetical protein